MKKASAQEREVIYIEMTQNEIDELLSMSVNSWDFDEETLRIFLSDTDLLNLFDDHSEIAYFIDVVKDTTIAKDGGRWVYLTELYPVHKALFESIDLITGEVNYPSFIYEEKPNG